MNLFVIVNLMLAGYAGWHANYFWMALCLVLAWMCSDNYRKTR